MTKPTKSYRWVRDNHRHRGNTWRLQCENMFDAIATIHVATELWPKRRLVCSARYKWKSTGNKPEGKMECASVVGGKAWCEKQLSAFWEPPTIEVSS